jgi:uncharacterized protein YjgD (DUF1641 family)
MANPVLLELPAHDPRAELQTRLQHAPAEHAEALLALYEVLQNLHNLGVFEILRGGLVSSDKVAGIVVDTVKMPEFIRGIRNGMVMAKLLGAIEPELLEGLARALPEAIDALKSQNSKPPGLLSIFKQFSSHDSRRVMALGGAMVEAIGRNLPHDKPGESHPPA